tara:strand:+ start:11458 stop:12582 length:1125 start_codon:yes stop_codon:yes gene_type:complete
MNVTVQKGHDFSTGNVTRAALNAGAIPTIALSGTVGTSEIANGAITNLKVNDSANIAVSKLALGANKLIIGDANGKASALSPAAQFQHGNTGMGNENDTNCGLLVDTGDKYEVLSTDVSAVGGQIELTKFRAANDSPFWLKLNISANSIKGSHFSEAAYDNASIGKDASGKLAIKDGGVHHQKLYPYKNADTGTNLPGFLVYGASGVATVLEAPSDPSVPVTVSASGTPITKVYRKYINLGKFTTGENTGNGYGWKRAAHGIGTGSTVPNHVSVILHCTNTNTSTHGYTLGDRIYIGGSADAHASEFFIHADGTYVTVSIPAGGHIEILKKNGGDDPDSSTHAGEGNGNVNADILDWLTSTLYNEFDVIAVVSE